MENKYKSNSRSERIKQSTTNELHNHGLQAISRHQTYRQSQSRLSEYSRRSSIVSRASTRNIKGNDISPLEKLKIMDANIDRTPKPMLSVSLNASYNNMRRSLMDGLETPESDVSENFLDHMSMASFAQSTAALESKSSLKEKKSIVNFTKEKTKVNEKINEIRYVIEKKSMKYEISENEDLEEEIEVMLIETDTIELLNIKSVSVCMNEKEAKIEIEKNKKYLDLLKLKQLTKERYSDTEVQTIDAYIVNQETQTETINIIDSSAQASVWDISDSMNDKQNVCEDYYDIKKLETQNDIESQSESRLSMWTIEGEKFKDSKRSSISRLVVNNSEIDMISNLEELPSAINIIESALNQNIYYNEYLLYRDIKIPDKRDIINDTDELMSPSSHKTETTIINDSEDNASSIATEIESQGDLPKLQMLWSWECQMTHDRTVTCMTWNKKNKDLLVVGYGLFKYNSNNKEGLIAFWTLKSPKYPIYHFKTKSSISSVDFSELNPNLLAIGMNNGTISIYDIQSKSNILESTFDNGKHMEPVWQLKWIKCENNNEEEVLISMASDGRISKWTMKKGLEYIDIMKLKKISSSKTNKTSYMTLNASGLSLDFHLNDPKIYITGMEDGWIHKCSISYSGQYLESFHGHIGPVYTVKWSPFLPGLFLSCSADWTMQLWMEGQKMPLMTLSGSVDVINDIQWCPFNSTIFSSVSNMGKIEIWDLSVSIVKPVAFYRFPGCKLTKVLFGEKSPILLCSDDKGFVNVIRTFFIERRDENREVAIKRLKKILNKNLIKK